MGGTSWLLGTSLFQHLAALGWLITLTVGPPAVLLLWWRHEVGHILGIFLYGNICLYYLLGLTFFRAPGTQYGHVFLSIFYISAP
jgi:hypothetical protein